MDAARGCGEGDGERDGALTGGTQTTRSRWALRFRRNAIAAVAAVTRFFHAALIGGYVAFTWRRTAFVGKRPQNGGYFAAKRTNVPVAEFEPQYLA